MTSSSAARALDDPKTPDEELKRIARDLFLTGETGETLWDDAYLAIAADAPAMAEFRELAAIWPSISHSRQQRIQYARDQYHLSRLEEAHAAESNA